MGLNRLVDDAAYGTGHLFAFGAIRSGKTGLFLGLAEKVHELNPSRPIYIQNYGHVSHLLPDWLHTFEALDEVPAGSLVIKDDTGTDDATHSKSRKKEQKEFAKRAALHGQLNLFVMYGVQNAYWISPDLFRAGKNHVVYKNYDYYSLEFERDFIQDRIRRVLPELRRLAEKWSLPIEALGYLDSYLYQGFFRSGLPDWWCDEISEALGDQYERRRQEAKREEAMLEGY